jgi:hypothetical protein
MKIGQDVNYYDPTTKERQSAKVAKIVGAGDSTAKILDLHVGEAIVEGVNHGTNAKEGEPFWLIPGLEKVPTGWAEHEGEEPVVSIESTSAVVAPVAIEQAKEAADALRGPRKRR